MKKSLFAAAMLSSVAALTFTSCNFLGDGDMEIEYFPVQLEKDGKWGMINPKGETLFSEEFKNQPSVVIEGVFSVQEGETYTLYKADKKPKVIEGCEGLVSIGVMQDGLIPIVRKGERITIANNSGKTVATLNPVNGKEITTVNPYYTDGLLTFITEENKCGAVDGKGKVVISPKYEGLGDFKEGYAIASKKLKDDKIQSVIINKKGEEVAKIKEGFELKSYSFQDGMVVASDGDGRYGFINTKGEFKRAPGKVKQITNYNAEYYVYANDEGEYGVMRFSDDEIIIKAKYSGIAILDNGEYLVRDDNETFIMNNDGDKKVEFDEDYKMVFPLTKDATSFFATEGSHCLVLDKEGKPVNKDEYNDFGVSLSASGLSVQSDYINIDGIVNDVIGSITDNGVGKYKVGMPVSQLGLEAKEYTYSTTFRNEDLNKKGYRYDIEFEGEADNTIAFSQFNYNGWDYNYSYYFNPDSKVKTLALTVSAKSDIWDSAREKLFNALTGKGFKVVTKGTAGAEFKKGNAYVEVLGEKNHIVVVATNSASNVDFSKYKTANDAAYALKNSYEQVVEEIAAETTVVADDLDDW